MKKIILILVTVVMFLGGCGETDAAKIAIEAEFDVSFLVLDHEESFAEFTVYGLPTEEEFDQIDEIISDSLSNQDMIEGETYDIYMYTSLQTKNKEAPVFGTVTYKDGEIVSNELANITLDQYIAISEL